MALPKIYDRVGETSTTTGTGNLALLGAITGFQAFTVVGNGNKCCFMIEESTGSWEVSVGTYTSAGATLSRDKILASSNSGAAVNFGVGTRQVYLLNAGAAALTPTHAICQGRLTLTSGTPVTTSDVTGATSVYFTPFYGNLVGVFDGYSWQIREFSELTLALGTISNNTNYDVFLYDNSGTLTLEALAWTDATNRATALASQDGVYVKSGATTRRYLGTFRTTSTTTTEDSAGGTVSQTGGKRFLWNAYNRVDRHIAVIDTTSSWTYAVSTWRSANNTTANAVYYVCGLSEDAVNVQAFMLCNTNSDAGGTGIGIDSTSANSAILLFEVNIGGGGSGHGGSLALYNNYPGIGYHAINWLEYRRAGTVTFKGNGGFSDSQSGLLVRVKG